MKKITGLLFICIICISIITLSGCSSNTSGGSEDSINKVTITIYTNEIPTTFPVTIGEQALVTSFTKSGYYLVGIFDQEEGGTKYFDSNRKSVGVWQQYNPTSLYTQWGIFSEVSKTFDIIFSDDPDSYSWSKNLTWVLENELLNAVKGNLDKELQISLSFRIKEGKSTIFSTNGSTNRITLKDSAGSGAEAFGTKEVVSYENNYEQHTLSWTAPARCGRTGKIIIEFNRGNNFNEAYIRDLVLSVSFI